MSLSLCDITNETDLFFIAQTYTNFGFYVFPQRIKGSYNYATSNPEILAEWYNTNKYAHCFNRDWAVKDKKRAMSLANSKYGIGYPICIKTGVAFRNEIERSLIVLDSDIENEEGTDPFLRLCYELEAEPKETLMATSGGGRGLHRYYTVNPLLFEQVFGYDDLIIKSTNKKAFCDRKIGALDIKGTDAHSSIVAPPAHKAQWLNSLEPKTLPYEVLKYLCESKSLSYSEKRDFKPKKKRQNVSDERIEFTSEEEEYLQFWVDHPSGGNNQLNEKMFDFCKSLYSRGVDEGRIRETLINANCQQSTIHIDNAFHWLSEHFE